MGFPARSPSIQSLLGESVKPLVRLQTYKNICYLVLSFPLGFMYGMFLGFGLIFGIGLSLIVIGLGILAVVVVLIRALTGFERWLSNRLLAVTVAEPAEDLSGEGSFGSLRSMIEADSTWRGLGFLTLKLWFGIIGIVLLFGFSTAYSMLMAVVERPRSVNFGEVNGEPVIWTIETVPEAAIAGVIGVVITFVLLHLSNLFGYVAGRVSVSLLGD